MCLKKGDVQKAKELAKNWAKFKSQQPQRSAGCIFRNPHPFFAGKLIEECGLKNARRGDAIVSSTHANFILNENKATSKDVRELINYIKNVVKEKKQIHLQEEIYYLTYE